MKRKLLACALALVLAPVDGALAQQPQGPRPYFVGNPLGLPVEPGADGSLAGISANVK